MTAVMTRKPGTVMLEPPIGQVKRRPIIHSTTMKSMPSRNALRTRK